MTDIAKLRTMAKDNPTQLYLIKCIETLQDLLPAKGGANDNGNGSITQTLKQPVLNPDHIVFHLSKQDLEQQRQQREQRYSFGLLIQWIIEAYEMMFWFNENVQHPCINDLVLMPLILSQKVASKKRSHDENDENNDKRQRTHGGNRKNKKGGGFTDFFRFCCFRVTKDDVVVPVKVDTRIEGTQGKDTNVQMLTDSNHEEYRRNFRAFHMLIEHIHEVERKLDEKAEFITELLTKVGDDNKKKIMEFCRKEREQTLMLPNTVVSPQEPPKPTYTHAYILYLYTALKEIAKNANKVVSSEQTIKFEPLLIMVECKILEYTIFLQVDNVNSVYNVVIIRENGRYLELEYDTMMSEVQSAIMQLLSDIPEQANITVNVKILESIVEKERGIKIGRIKQVITPFQPPRQHSYSYKNMYYEYSMNIKPKDIFLDNRLQTGLTARENDGTKYTLAEDNIKNPYFTGDIVSYLTMLQKR